MKPSHARSKKVKQNILDAVKNNLIITIRNDRGKKVGTREGHNIWLDTGRIWHATRMGYSDYSPLTEENVNAIRYMGFGIGGTRQIALGVANALPLGTVSGSYPGTNNQTDIDSTVETLERPVRITGGTSTYPGNTGTDTWLVQVQAPTHPTPTRTTFKAIITETDVSYGPYLVVPLSEVMLFLHSSNPLWIHTAFNQGIAYDTFETISKTNKLQFEVDWTLVF